MIERAHTERTEKVSTQPFAVSRRSAMIWIWFLSVVFSFWLLDGFSLTLGDDFGYMFADTRHHACDGARVETFADCIDTQANHYFTTNGRFAVHIIDMAMLNLVPDFIYRLLNALMFGLMWYLTMRLGFGRRPAGVNAALTLLMLWLFLPDFGTILLSLHSFSINYMWTGVGILFLLSLTPEGITERWRRWLLYLFALLCGSLQESFSIPLSAAFILDTALSWHSSTARAKLLRTFFVAGTCICVFAPGNIHHFMQGGGFASASLSHKFLSFAGALPLTPLPLLAALIGVAAIFRWKSLRRFVKANRILLIAIITALGFASFTFTSTRQLFAPSLFAIVIICRMATRKEHFLKKHSIALTSISLTLLIALMSGAWVLRRDVWENQDSFLRRSIQEGGSIVYADASRAPYNTHPLLWKILGSYAPDPWERSRFSFPFDAYSRQGLSRLVFGADAPYAIKAVLPYSPDYIIDRTPVTEPNADGTYLPQPLDSRYKAVAVRGPQPASVRTDDPSGVHCELFLSSGACYAVVPASVKTITFR